MDILQSIQAEREEKKSRGIKFLKVLASGEGTLLENLCHHCDQGILRDKAEIVGVITNKKDAGVLDVAKKWGVISTIVEFNEYWNTISSWQEYIYQSLDCPPKPDLIVLAGYTSYLKIKPEYEGKIINIHPTLLPKFSGKGMYDGLNPHQAVIDAKEKESGCTIHLVDKYYYNGKILGQQKVPVLSDDTATTLQKRVREAEWELLPKTILKLLDNPIGEKNEIRQIHATKRRQRKRQS